VNDVEPSKQQQKRMNQSKEQHKHKRNNLQIRIKYRVGVGVGVGVGFLPLKISGTHQRLLNSNDDECSIPAVSSGLRGLAER
jgi:hypothetical protein